jgi:hypothetical protein
MMTSRDIWAPLSAGSHDARVVVRTASGEEVDVKSVRCCAQRCVIETDEPLHTIEGAREVAIDSSCPEDETITPDQLSELLDAHTASIEEIILMLGELQYRGIDNLEQLAAQLALAEEAE